jgi:hypothetical protein
VLRMLKLARKHHHPVRSALGHPQGWLAWRSTRSSSPPPLSQPPHSADNVHYVKLKLFRGASTSRSGDPLDSCISGHNLYGHHPALSGTAFVLTVLGHGCWSH